MLLLIILFVLSFIGSGQSCSGSGVGTWTAWSISSSCENCTAAGVVANGQFKIRLCIPPLGSSCIYDTFSCSGSSFERTWCQEQGGQKQNKIVGSRLVLCNNRLKREASWSSWSCACCGGCLTSRCTRICVGGTWTAYCTGDPVKEDNTTTCTSPSPVCKFPLANCCDSKIVYLNTTAKARWCS